MLPFSSVHCHGSIMARRHNTAAILDQATNAIYIFSTGWMSR